MARIFLDNNYFIDAVHRKPENRILHQLQNHSIFISALSVPNLYYIFKIKVPNSTSIIQLSKFNLIDLSKEILGISLEGPLSDIEDNIQLHSAVRADCNEFLTNDKNLLRMKFFGKMKIASEFST